MSVWYLIFSRRKWNSTRWGNFQSDFIYQYIEIFKSNPLQKIKKWNQFGLNTVLCMYSSWLIPVLFMKNTGGKWRSKQKGTNKQKSIISLISRLGSVAKMWEFFGRGHHVLRGLTKKKGLHTKRMLNDARQETTQTTLVDNSDFLQSGNAVLSSYTNKLIYLSTLYLKSYVHLLFYIIV